MDDMAIDANLADPFPSASLLASQGNWQAAYQELRQGQQRLLQEERLQALAQMASGFAHDLNNALTPIIGYSDFLLDTDATLTPESRTYLQSIRTAAGDIAKRVDRLRQFYRVRDEEAPRTSIDLARLARQVIDLTQQRWRDVPSEEGISIKLRTYFERQLPYIRENETEIREAITNLILNALEAMPRGGTLSVKTLGQRSQEKRRDQSAIARVILEVSDTGVGMDEATRQHCLEPFFSTKNLRGSGLGLSMVYGLMRRNGGAVEIESEPGRGTTVQLVFHAEPSLLQSQSSFASGAGSLSSTDRW
jgi:signal transduction histidine kinase